MEVGGSVLSGADVAGPDVLIYEGVVGKLHWERSIGILVLGMMVMLAGVCSGRART